MCRDPVAIQNLLKSAGADPTILDNRQRSAKYYMKNPFELELPSAIKSASEPKKPVTVKEGKSLKLIYYSKVLSIKKRRFMT